MRNHLSQLLLVVVPAFALLPAAALLMGVNALGWRFGVTMLIGTVAGEIAFGLRRLRKKREELARDADAAIASETSLALTREEHPGIWGLVDGLASEAGVLPPARIAVTMSTTAAVAPIDVDRRTHPEPHSAPRPYELRLSPVFLAEAQIPDLKAVLAHEFGHVAAGDLMASARLHRLLSDWYAPAYLALPPGLVKLGLWLHAQAWRPVAAWARRPTERLADDVSFAVAGPRTAAEALALAQRLHGAQSLALGRYLEPAIRAQLRGSIIEAVHGVRCAPAGSWTGDVVPATGFLDWLWSVHPPIQERIAAAGRAAAEGRDDAADDRSAQDRGLPAADLLSGGRDWLIDHEAHLYRESHVLAAAPTAHWDTIVDLGWRLFLADEAQELAGIVTKPYGDDGRPVTRAGEGWALVDARPEDVTARMLLEAMDRVGWDVVIDDPHLAEVDEEYLLLVICARALDAAGRLRLPHTAFAMPWQPEYLDGDTWLALPGLADPPTGQRGANRVERGVEEVLAGRAAVASLITVLDKAGADLDAPIGLSQQQRTDRPGGFLGALAAVTLYRDSGQIAGKWCALVATTGLWLVPEPQVGRAMSLDQEDAQKRFMQRLAADFGFAGRPDLEAYPGSLWLPESDIREVRLRGTVRQRVDLLGDDGVMISLGLRLTAPAHGMLLPEALLQTVASRIVA